MDQVTLEASVRAETGTGIGRSLRREGRIPAVVYGEGQAPTALVTTERALTQALRTASGENVLITLKVTDPTGAVLPDRTVLIKEIQHHPVTSRILHVDFHQISLTRRIQVTVPLQFTGEAIGVKQAGGRLDHLLWEVRVECLPTQIPERLAVDVSALNIGDGLLIKDLVVPSGVKIVHEPHVAVVACLPPVVEEAPVAAAAATAPTEPEVIKQKKPEAEEGATAATEAKAEKKE